MPKTNSASQGQKAGRRMASETGVESKVEGLQGAGQVKISKKASVHKPQQYREKIAYTVCSSSLLFMIFIS